MAYSLLGVLLGFLDALRIDIVTRPARRAELLHGRDHDASVAATEVVMDVTAPGIAKLKHGLDHLGRGRDVGNVLMNLGLL